MITVADLIAYRRRTEKLVERVAEASLPTQFGDFRVVGYRSLLDSKHHVALVKGDVAAATREGKSVMVRVHSECLTGDVFHSLRCDCGQQLEDALSRIESEGLGVLLYLAQEGRGIGLLNKLRAYKLQEEGLDTVEANIELGLPADLRDYGVGAQILVDLGLKSISILTNNPKKIVGLEGFGLDVTDQIPIEHAPGEHNADYLKTKREKMGHTLHHQGLPLDEEMIDDERKADRKKREIESRLVAGLVEQSENAIRIAESAVTEGRPGVDDGPALRDRARTFYDDLARRLTEGALRGFEERESASRASTCSTCPAPSSCRWPPRPAPSPASTPASPASAP